MYVTETEDSKKINQNVKSASINSINVSPHTFVFYNNLLT